MDGGNNKTLPHHINIKCGNCGIKGHVYANCKLPILSYGIILIRKIDNVSKILLVQRKDSLTYIEFIRGKYDINDKSYLQMMFNRMTKTELLRILNNNIEYLWNNLWLIDNNNNNNIEPRFMNEFIKSRILFNKIKEGFNVRYPSINKHKTENFSVKENVMKISLKYFIENSLSNYDTPEWGFPKGRRNFNESDIDASIREFEEETNIDRKHITIFNNIFPFVEEFYGSNNVKYKHVYYLAKYNLDEDIDIPIINKNNMHQITEIGDIKWANIDESEKLFRPYEKTKLATNAKIFQFINNYTKFCGEYC